MSTLIEAVYSAAASAGLLQICIWQPADGRPTQTHPVGWGAADQDVLSGLSSSTEFVMTYPSSCFVGLGARDSVQIEGATFQVREVQALHDGSEMRARLMKVM